MDQKQIDDEAAVENVISAVLTKWQQDAIRAARTAAVAIVAELRALDDVDLRLRLDDARAEYAALLDWAAAHDKVALPGVEFVLIHYVASQRGLYVREREDAALYAWITRELAHPGGLQ